MPARSLADWLEHIESLHPRKWDLGLDRVKTVAERMDLLHPDGIIFLVAGTNGKGSTCEYIDRFCRDTGLVVGKSTSPHLLSFNERIQINGIPVPDEEICAAFEIINSIRGDISLTYFEFSTLASLYLFKQRQVDVTVLEIGLGGRLDAMNIIDPDVSVVTQIALDHQEWLGDSRELIAVEKAAILRPGKYSVISDRSPPESLVAYAESCKCVVKYIGQDFEYRPGVISVESLSVTELPTPAMPGDSAAAALQAVMLAGIYPGAEDVRRVIADAHLPGRLQWLQRKPDVLLDVAHNPAAAMYLLNYLQSLNKTGKLHSVVGMYRDKAFSEILPMFDDRVDHWYFTDMDDERAATSQELARVIEDNGCRVQSCDNIANAFSKALRNCAIEDMILVFGSFPVVAGVLHMAVEYDGTSATTRDVGPGSSSDSGWQAEDSPGVTERSVR
ncbi:MAG: bifunctional tetrahydrofolate synthase/dihydrofolate synthase [Gammaproteobacteria bacterium]|nr:bifunctional tetrahydrofolate synthase/dihydrofolate synthase [Gammaproteobacteria bacterium]